MADVFGNGLVVWNNEFGFKRLNSNQYYSPDNRNNHFEVGGKSFNIAAGTLGMALSPKFSVDDRRKLLAFRPLSSRSMYFVESNNVIYSNSESEIQYYGGVDILPSQASAMAFSSDGILFFGLVSEMGIGCWNMRTPLDRNYIVR